MSVAGWLKEANEELANVKIQTARLDCLILLEDCTLKDRSWLLANSDFELSAQQIEELDSRLKRRSDHEPLAYIRNKTEFYGRNFYVDRRVLQPRPESEIMIKLLKNLDIKNRQAIVDIGTGSGALAITAKLEIPRAKVLATDISSGCIRVAQQNAKALKANIQFLKGSLLIPLHSLELKNYILICNLPYVPKNFKLNRAATKEPQKAIFGGITGLDLYQKLFHQIKKSGYKPSFILTESLPQQHKMLIAMAASSGYKLVRTEDLVQCFKQI